MESTNKYIPYLFFVIGYGGFLYSLYTAYLSSIARNWKKTNGNVTHSSIESNCDEDGCTYKPIIHYNFEVRGRHYESKHIAFGFISNSIYYLTSRIRNKFPFGANVTVYYKHNNPKRSVLIIGLRLFHIFNIVTFGAIIIITYKGAA